MRRKVGYGLIIILALAFILSGITTLLVSAGLVPIATSTAALIATASALLLLAFAFYTTISCFTTCFELINDYTLQALLMFVLGAAFCALSIYLSINLTLYNSANFLYASAPMIHALPIPIIGFLMLIVGVLSAFLLLVNTTPIIYMSPKKFEKQLRALSERGYATEAEAIAALEKTLQKKARKIECIAVRVGP